MTENKLECKMCKSHQDQIKAMKASDEDRKSIIMEQGKLLDSANGKNNDLEDEINNLKRYCSDANERIKSLLDAIDTADEAMVSMNQELKESSKELNKQRELVQVRERGLILANRVLKQIEIGESSNWADYVKMAREYFEN